MTEGITARNGRCLAGIESDLREAEQAYADADARYIEAENDRRAAIEAINRHQSEMDHAVGQLRQYSIPGTHWNSGPAAGEQPLELDTRDILARESKAALSSENLTSGSTAKAAARGFDRLRESDASDPVLKVVASPRN